MREYKIYAKHNIQEIYETDASGGYDTSKPVGTLGNDSDGYVLAVYDGDKIMEYYEMLTYTRAEELRNKIIKEEK